VTETVLLPAAMSVTARIVMPFCFTPSPYACTVTTRLLPTGMLSMVMPVALPPVTVAVVVGSLPDAMSEELIVMTADVMPAV